MILKNEILLILKEKFIKDLRLLEKKLKGFKIDLIKFLLKLIWREISQDHLKMKLLKIRMFRLEISNQRRVIFRDINNLMIIIIKENTTVDNLIKVTSIEKLIKNMNSKIIYIEENTDLNETLDTKIDEMNLDKTLAIKKDINNYNF